MRQGTDCQFELPTIIPQIDTVGLAYGLTDLLGIGYPFGLFIAPSL